MDTRRFRDRTEAGEALAMALRTFATEHRAIVIGVARGGAAIARVVADTLELPYGVLASRKILIPGIEEVPIGAIAQGSPHVVTNPFAQHIGVPLHVTAQLVAQERTELERMSSVYQAVHQLPPLEGRTIILVDDELVTGATFRAAIAALRISQPRKIIAAVPVAAQSSANAVQAEVDELVVLHTAVTATESRASYANIGPLGDQDVVDWLSRPNHIKSTGKRSAANTSPNADSRMPAAASHPRAERTIEIPVYGGVVPAAFGSPQLEVAAPNGSTPLPARGLVILMSGKEGSNDHFRNRYFAGRFRLGGYATLRVDLHDYSEWRDETHVDDVPRHATNVRIAARLLNVCDWATREGIDGAHRLILTGPDEPSLFALEAAARNAKHAFAIIAFGGSVELARDLASRLATPVLLIDGVSNRKNLPRHTKVQHLWRRNVEFIRVLRAGKSFSEPGALGAVAEQAVKWLEQLNTPRLQTQPVRYRALCAFVNWGIYAIGRFNGQ